MYKFKKVSVYKPQETKQGRRRTNITNLRNKAGVYFITENNRVVYIGHSKSDLYTTILRHFQTWNDPRQKRTVYNPSRSSYKVYGYITKPADALPLEQNFIQKKRPRDNKSKIEEISKRQADRARIRMKKALHRPPEHHERFTYADSGELLDENGNVLF